MYLTNRRYGYLLIVLLAAPIFGQAGSLDKYAIPPIEKGAGSNLPKVHPIVRQVLLGQQLTATQLSAYQDAFNLINSKSIEVQQDWFLRYQSRRDTSLSQNDFGAAAHYDNLARITQGILANAGN